MNNYNKIKCVCPPYLNADPDTRPTSNNFSPTSWYTCVSESETFYDASDVIGAHDCGDTNQSASKLKETPSLTTIMRAISDPQKFRLALSNIVETAEGLLAALDGAVRGSAEKCKQSITTIMAPKVPFQKSSKSSHPTTTTTTATTTSSRCSCSSTTQPEHVCVNWNNGVRVCVEPITVSLPLTLYIEPKIVQGMRDNSSTWQKSERDDQTIITCDEDVIQLSEDAEMEPIRTSAISPPRPSKPLRKPLSKRKLRMDETQSSPHVGYPAAMPEPRIASVTIKPEIPLEYTSQSTTTASTLVPKKDEKEVAERDDLDRSRATQDDRDRDHENINDPQNTQTLTGPGRTPDLPTARQDQPKKSGQQQPNQLLKQEQQLQQQWLHQQQEHEQQEEASCNEETIPPAMSSSEQFYTPNESDNVFPTPCEAPCYTCFPDILPPPPLSNTNDIPPNPPPSLVDLTNRANPTVKISFTTKVYSPQASFECICRNIEGDEEANMWEPFGFDLPPPIQPDPLPCTSPPPGSIVKISFTDKYDEAPNEMDTLMYEHTCNCQSPDTCRFTCCPNCKSIPKPIQYAPADKYERCYCKRMRSGMNAPIDFERLNHEDLENCIQNCCQITLLNAANQNVKRPPQPYIYAYNPDECDDMKGCYCECRCKHSARYQGESPDDMQLNIADPLPDQEIEINQPTCDCGNPDCCNKSCLPYVEDTADPQSVKTMYSGGSADEKLLPILEGIYEVLQCMRDEQIRLSTNQTSPDVSARNIPDSDYYSRLEQENSPSEPPPPPPSSPLKASPTSMSETSTKRYSRQFNSHGHELRYKLSQVRMSNAEWYDANTILEGEQNMEIQEPPERDIDQPDPNRASTSPKRVIPVDLDLLRTEEDNCTTTTQDGSTGRDNISVDCQVDPTSLGEPIPPRTQQKIKNAFGFDQNNASDISDITPDITRKAGVKGITFCRQPQPGVPCETQVSSASFEELPRTSCDTALRTHEGSKKSIQSTSTTRGSISEPNTISSESLTGVEIYSRISKFSNETCNCDDPSSCASTCYRQPKPESSLDCKCSFLSKCVKTCCRHLTSSSAIDKPKPTSTKCNVTDCACDNRELCRHDCHKRLPPQPGVSKDIQNNEASLHNSVPRSAQFLVSDGPCPDTMCSNRRPSVEKVSKDSVQNFTARLYNPRIETVKEEKMSTCSTHSMTPIFERKQPCKTSDEKVDKASSVLIIKEAHTSDIGTDRPEFEQAENQLVVAHKSCSCSACQKAKSLAVNVPQNIEEKFIDSIISDLKVMREKREKASTWQCNSPPLSNNVLSNVTKPGWQKPPADLAFPVSLEKVEELGSDSLFIKWRVHSFNNIAGYEIFLDGRLTNRYFSFIHRAAVICNVDLTCPHRIILRAQPQIKGTKPVSGRNLTSTSHNYPESPGACCLQPDGTLWYPSVFLYEPKSYKLSDEANVENFRAA